MYKMFMNELFFFVIRSQKKKNKISANVQFLRHVGKEGKASFFLKKKNFLKN